MKLAASVLIVLLSCVSCARLRTEAQSTTAPAIEFLESLRLELIEVARKIGRQEHEAARLTINLLCRRIGEMMAGSMRPVRIESVLNEAEKALQELR